MAIPDGMRAMVLERPGTLLRERVLPVPELQPGTVLVKVSACAVCRTDLHVIDGELADPKSPLIPGHEIVARVAKLAPDVTRFKLNERVGIPWLGWTCGACDFCRSGHENLCDRARFTGYTIDGGYAEFVLADARFCFPLPAEYSDAEAAPLLCAGLIGYRSLRKTGDAERVGIYGFGAAAHIVTQVARYEGRKVFAFTRQGDTAAKVFARSLGAAWSGSSDEAPPEALDAAIIFAPVGALVPEALKRLRKGGVVVCGGIHMSEIPAFPYELLWHERSLCSVANLTREDGEEFLKLAPRIPIRTHIQEFPLREANEALERLRSGKLEGAAVLVPDFQFSS